MNKPESGKRATIEGRPRKSSRPRFKPKSSPLNGNLVVSNIISDDEIREAFKQGKLESPVETPPFTFGKLGTRLKMIITELDVPAKPSNNAGYKRLNKLCVTIKSARDEFRKAHYAHHIDHREGWEIPFKRIIADLEISLSTISHTELSVVEKFVASLAVLFVECGGRAIANSREKNGKSTIDGPFVRFVAVLSRTRVNGRMVQSSLKKKQVKKCLKNPVDFDLLQKVIDVGK